jgi:flagellar protein FliL
MSATAAEAPDTEAAPEDGADAPAEAKKKGKLPSKKMMLLIGGPLALLIVGLAAAYFLGVFGGAKEAEPAHQEAKGPKPIPNFFELPDLLVNLNSSGGKRQHFLKLSVSLEVPNAEDTARLKAMQPRIVDTFQTFLRDLRVEDLQGSEGVHLVREELLRRVNAVAEPVSVTGVLFREMLVQ